MATLTATQVKQAQPGEKARKLSDGQGLYLLIQPNGARYWRYNYRYAGKRKTLALGVYPDVSLKAARGAHQEARGKLANGIDPGAVRKVEKLTRHLAAAESFEAVATEWQEVRMGDKAQATRDRVASIMGNYLTPWLGNRPIADIGPQELLAALRRAENAGTLDSAHRARQIAGQVFRYAVVTGRAQHDPSASLKGALTPNRKTHHAAITDPAEVGKLLVAMDTFEGTTVVKAALLMSPLLFQRPGELRAMEWTEINRDARQWEIPAEKMKMRQPHIVPLSRQAEALLDDLEPLTRRSRYVFPSARGASRCMSDNAVRVALRTIGYDKHTMTPHGFRAMARTILDEVLNYRVDYIEHQLAHAVKDANGRAYNRTAHLEARREMMQGWADYLDKLRAQAKAGNVITAKFGTME
ncbi:MAG: integrase arm-type DNA-binding domain-containing protein [Halioglobus sp.]|nr:integrase arm-type DNA-binding domain-containing protein [Halioglobus sp.]MCB1714983.1 integrase arm-type DNA-binding domain-containing protein [Candidatus Competibacteraceae bacterium]